MTRDTMESWQLQAESLQDNPETVWKPDPGDAIAGRVIDIARNVGLSAGSTQAVLETEAGDRVGVWFSAVLAKQFQDHAVKSGDVVAIKFTGWKENHRGDRYKTFAMKVLERGPHE